MQVYNRVLRSEKASVTGSWRGKKRVGSKFGKGRLDKEWGCCSAGTGKLLED